MSRTGATKMHTPKGTLPPENIEIASSNFEIYKNMSLKHAIEAVFEVQTCKLRKTQRLQVR